MAGHAPHVEIPQLSGASAVIISARWHREICQTMVLGAKRALREAGINNPEKARALQSRGITTIIKEIASTPNPFNENYIRTKRERLGHTTPSARNAKGDH